MPSWNSREELLGQVGRLSQVGGISPFVHADGKAKGTGTLRVRTARGLEFWVVPDKGMDIYEASYQGRSLCWHSPTGMVHPSYFSSRGLEWLKGFTGGLLTTCGLAAAGAPSRDEGEDLGLHGSISNTPAENVSWSETWEKDDCILQVSGSVRETSVHGPNLVLQRTVTTSLNRASFVIHDVVENQGVRTTPLMVLYHFNFGYPLLTPKARVYAPSKNVEPIDDFSAASVNEWDLFDSPRMGQGERVYFHEMESGTSDRGDRGACKRWGRPELWSRAELRSDDIAEVQSVEDDGRQSFRAWARTRELQHAGKRARTQAGDAPVSGSGRAERVPSGDSSS